MALKEVTIILDQEKWEKKVNHRLDKTANFGWNEKALIIDQEAFIQKLANLAEELLDEYEKPMYMLIEESHIKIAEKLLDSATNLDLKERIIHEWEEWANPHTMLEIT